MKKGQWVVLDLETTGLTPQGHVILECAMLPIDSKTLAPMDDFNRVVGHEVLPEMDMVVEQMHTSSGLLDQVRRNANPRKPLTLRSHAELDAAICSFMQEHEEIVIVGQSIGALDIPFIKWHLPNFAKKLHYRSIDVRTALRLYEEWVGPLPNVIVVHRAMSDCLMSLAWLNFLKERAFAKPALSTYAEAEIAKIRANVNRPDGPGDVPQIYQHQNYDGNGSSLPEHDEGRG